MIKKVRRVFTWFQKNERHLSAPIFVVGFLSDIFSVGKLPISYAVDLYGAYLLVTIVATIGGHYLQVRDAQEGWPLKALRILLSFIAQFTTGGMLSGCLIFYTRSAALIASWPFVFLLGAVFVGNEFFRHYREKLAFRSVLLFFALYAYVIFALPTLLHTINPRTFLESSLVALGIFAMVLCALAATGLKKLQSSFLEIAIGTFCILGLVNLCYFTGIIPPLPLSLSDVGVYHSVTRTPAGYVVEAESEPHVWWDIGNIEPVTLHITQNEPLSVFSAVFAPTSFSTAIVHRWQEYDPQKHAWETKAVIAFAITGGRDNGYRGYSTLSNLSAGKYRVSIETLSGQVIGQQYFTVQIVPADPALHTETH